MGEGGGGRGRGVGEALERGEEYNLHSVSQVASPFEMRSRI